MKQTIRGVKDARTDTWKDSDTLTNTHTRKHTHTHTHTHIVYVCMRIFICMYKYAYIHKYMYECVYLGGVCCAPSIESYHTYERVIGHVFWRVMSNILLSLVAHINASYCTYQWVMLQQVRVEGTSLVTIWGTWRGVTALMTSRDLSGRSDGSRWGNHAKGVKTT